MRILGGTKTRMEPLPALRRPATYPVMELKPAFHHQSSSAAPTNTPVKGNYYDIKARTPSPQPRTMKIHPSKFSLRKMLSIVMLAISLTSASAIAAHEPASATKGDAALKQQVAELQAKNKQLEAALSAKAPSPAASPAMPPINQKMTPTPAMTPGASGAMGMGDMKMGGMAKDPSGSGSMPGGGMGGMMTGMM